MTEHEQEYFEGCKEDAFREGYKQAVDTCQAMVQVVRDYFDRRGAQGYDYVDVLYELETLINDMKGLADDM